MAQFNAAKNPPWVRDATTGLPAPAVTMVGGLGQPGTMLNQPGVATPTVYSLASTQMAGGQAQYSSQQLGVANLVNQQAAAVQLSQPGIAIPTSLATSQIQTVSYPAPRQAVQQPGQQQPKQRVFTGTVTKLHENFGFVDEDVFFQTSCVKGVVPKVADRVLVEASYNANMPFKWNATRIQVLPSQQKMPTPVPPQNNSGFNSLKNLPAISPAHLSQPPPPLMSQNPQPPTSIRTQLPVAPAITAGGGGRGENSRFDRVGGRDRERDRRSPPRRRSPIRKRSRSPRRHSRSPSRRSSPSRNRRQARPSARYMVQVPKISLDMKEANVMALKARYSNMYIPSDFFNSSFAWIEAFPLHRPFELGRQCSYHVMHKEVEPIVKHDAVFEPPDADHLFSAKVMLAASPTIEDLYKKCCPLPDDASDPRDLQHSTRLISFLVGLKGKEPMAIGGPWSPSLDGANPSDDPRVLINTAIRTTRALTGIDLAGVTQWYRFAEIRYHRPEEVHKGRVVPARVETVVLFLPDVWSCNPSRIEWDGLALAYKKQLQDKYKEEGGGHEDTQEEEGDEESEAGGEPKDPTHFSELDPKSMKVNDLRKELEARSLSSKGLKSQLIARLTKAVKSEQEAEEQEAENKDEDEEEPEPPKKATPPPEVDEKEEEKKKKEDEEKKRREDRERVVRERRYTLPADTPSIVVHPSSTAKSGKFDCTVMSLSVLLDYRPDDNKEHTFEVSLFAELFNEMIMRDFGFKIYKSLTVAPEKPKDEDKKDKKKDKKDKHKEEKKESEKEEKQEEGKEEKKEDKKEDKKEEKKEDKKEEKKEEKKDEDKEDKKEDETEDGEPPVKKRKDEEKTEKSEKPEKSERRRESAWDKKVDKKKDDDKNDGDANDMDDEDDDKKSHKSERESSKDKKKEKVKLVVKDYPLLLAFSYFDLSHVGYLQDKDLEEIMHTIGLQLSRAQVKKLVTKITSKDQANYRKLTDKEEKKEETSDEKKSSPQKEGKTEQEEEAVAMEIDDESLAQGNKPLLPQSHSKETPVKKGRGKKESENLVMYKGAMVDIPSMVQRLEKSEKLKRETDTKLKDLQEEMDMLKDSCKSSEQTSQKVALELQELKKKLRDQRKATDRSETDAKKYHEVLSAAKATLSGTLNTIEEVINADSKTTSSPTVQVKKEVNGDDK